MSFFRRFDDPHQRRLMLLLGRALLVLLAVVGLVVFLGMALRSGDGTIDAQALIESARDSAWAPLLVVSIYVLLNFAGVPQFLLVGGTIVVFGPWIGFAYGWFGTLCSSSVGFWLGHFFGGELLRRFGGSQVNSVSARLAKHGILTSAIVRVVPAGPAIMVNMVLGVSHISYARFLLGTALGITPKILLIALVSEGVMEFVDSGNTLVLGGIAVLVFAWILAMIWARRVIGRWRDGEETSASGPSEADEERDEQDKTSNLT